MSGHKEVPRAVLSYIHNWFWTKLRSQILDTYQQSLYQKSLMNKFNSQWMERSNSKSFTAMSSLLNNPHSLATIPTAFSQSRPRLRKGTEITWQIPGSFCLKAKIQSCKVTNFLSLLKSFKNNTNSQLLFNTAVCPWLKKVQIVQIVDLAVRTRY